MLERQPDTFASMSQALVSFDGIADAEGITDAAHSWVKALSKEYGLHSEHNATLRKYYEGDVSASDYGATANIENDQTCHWPAKAVDALADRIRLKALTLADADEAMEAALDAVVQRNSLVDNYNRHVATKLLYGCMAATVTRGADGKSRVRFHSAETFTALPSPDYTDGVVAGGLAIARREVTPWSDGYMVPTVVNLHTPRNVGEFRQVDRGLWTYSDGPTREELPTLYVFSHEGKGTLAPFGRTRITKFVRTLAEDAIRCMWHMQISGTFYSMAKLYLTGLTDEQFDTVMKNKSEYQLTRLLALTMGVDGTNPNIGQLSGNSPQPFIDELRALACQFSGATGVPLNSLGIVQDNPSSAEAIQASREDICLIAERDMNADRKTLARVVKAAMAIDQNTTTDAIDVDVLAHFASPMITSQAASTDAAMKAAAVDTAFAGTEVFWEMQGFDDADISRIQAQERRNMGASVLADTFAEALNGS